MRATRTEFCLLVAVIVFSSSSRSIAQANRNPLGLTAYGKQTKKYMSAMHYTAIEVASKAVDLSRNHNLMAQKVWRIETLSQLRTLSIASRGIQSIRPVPKGYEQLDHDFAGLGKQMELAAATYKKGVQTQNDNLVYDAFRSMKDVDNTLVALSSMRNR